MKYEQHRMMLINSRYGRLPYQKIMMNGDFVNENKPIHENSPLATSNEVDAVGKRIERV
jgi:hypothetical protein